MKKIISALLVMTLVFFMVSCGISGEAEAAPEAAEKTAQTTVEPESSVPETVPEKSQEEYVGLAEELLREEGTTTVNFGTAEKYEELLQELGYTEFRLNYYVGASLACKPVSLTYNDRAFRLDFSYTDNVMEYHEMGFEVNFEKTRLVEGWALYGTKAEGAENISSLNFGDYPFVHTEDFMAMFAPEKTRALDICPENYQTLCTNDEDFRNWTNVAFHASVYNPFTGNLYNAVKVADSLEDACYDMPRVLENWKNLLMEAMQAKGAAQLSFVPGNLAKDGKIEPDYYAHIYLSNIYGCYEPGMTLKDWVESSYNFDGWTYEEEDGEAVLYAPERNYVIPLQYHPDGSLYTIDEYAVNGFCEVIMLEYEDYCTYKEQ